MYPLPDLTFPKIANMFPDVFCHKTQLSLCQCPWALFCSLVFCLLCGECLRCVSEHNENNRSKLITGCFCLCADQTQFSKPTNKHKLLLSVRHTLPYEQQTLDLTLSLPNKPLVIVQENTCFIHETQNNSTVLPLCCQAHQP